MIGYTVPNELAVETQPEAQETRMEQVNDVLAAGAPPLDRRHLAYLFEHVADVIFFLEVLDGERYRFIAINERFAETTGLPLSAVMGTEVDEVIPPPSLDLVKQKYRQAIASGKA